MCSRAACAAAPSSTWTRPPAPSPRRSSAPRPWPGSASRASPSPPPAASLPAIGCRRQGLARRPPDLRRRPVPRHRARRWPGLRCPAGAPIHLRPIAWSVDGQQRRARSALDVRPAARPRAAGRLDGRAVFQTLGHCVERAHLQFDGVVAAPFASALAALEDDEMDLGAICIDMGGGSTSVAVYSGGTWSMSTAWRSAAATSPPTSPAAFPPPSPAPSGSRPCTARPSPRPTRTAR